MMTYKLVLSHCDDMLLCGILSHNILIFISQQYSHSKDRQKQQKKENTQCTKNAYKAKSHKSHSVSNCLHTALATAPT